MSLSPGLQPKLKYLSKVVALAAVYYGLGKLALSHVMVSGWDVAVVWPPSGVALAALLIIREDSARRLLSRPIESSFLGLRGFVWVENCISG